MYCQTPRAARAHHPMAHRLPDDIVHVRAASLVSSRAAAWIITATPSPRTTSPEQPTDRGVAETVMLLEASAIAMGASRLSPECVIVARAAGAALRSCAHGTSAAARLARLFHQTLLAGCPNRHLLDLISESSGSTAPMWLSLIDDGDADRTVDDHEAILDLIASGAPAVDVERALRQHAQRSSLCSIGLAGS